jgi:hypothetical protein
MTDEPPNDTRCLSVEEVDNLLDGQAGAVAVFLAAGRDDPKVEHISVADKLAVASDPRATHWPDAQRALRHAQRRLSSQARNARAQVARELVAWWADVASVAVVAAVTGIAIHPVRVTAAEPDIVMSDVELDYLSEMSMAGALRDGLPLTFDDPTVEGRRRVLWGDDWIHDQVPWLPSAEELFNLLDGHGVGAELASGIGQARQEIAGALTASRRVREGEADNEELMDRAGRLTDLLVGYAQLLSDSLPIIRLSRL